MQKNKIVLVTGGARSGKSVFAELYAASAGGTVSYIATGQAFDEEMAVRIETHRRRRPEAWLTFEAPYAENGVVQEALEQGEVLLFDCLTLYISNLLLSSDAPGTIEERYHYIMDRVDKLLECARLARKTVIFVTNEVGFGIVPDNPLAREYRDLSGMVNRKIAACADEVYLVVSGLAVDIKKLAVNREEVK